MIAPREAAEIQEHRGNPLICPETPVLRYPTLAGVPPGGSQPCVDATASIAFGHPYHTYYNALAHSFLSLARVLLLLHVPRFPFHDSTGFAFVKKNKWKTIHLGFCKGPKSNSQEGLWGCPLGTLWEPLGRSSGAFLEAFRGSKNTEDRHRFASSTGGFF